MSTETEGGTVKSRDDKKRELLFEAFLGGWQAALAVNITDPRVIAAVEDCYDMWLEAMADEVQVLGFTFRRRLGLPGSRRHLLSQQSAGPDNAPGRRPAEEPAASDRERPASARRPSVRSRPRHHRRSKRSNAVSAAREDRPRASGRSG